MNAVARGISVIGGWRPQLWLLALLATAILPVGGSAAGIETWPTAAASEDYDQPRQLRPPPNRSRRPPVGLALEYDEPHLAPPRKTPNRAATGLDYDEPDRGKSRKNSASPSPSNLPPRGQSATETVPPDDPAIGGADYEAQGAGICDRGPTCENWCSPRCDSMWLRSEYIFWWTESIKLPALVTSSPVGTAENLAGILDQPGTTVLFGDEGAAGGVHAGGRISFGLWLTPCHSEGIEASYLGIGKAATRFRASGDDVPIIARPFVDTSANQQAAMLVSYPDLLRGSIAVDAVTEMQSAEVLWRHRLIARRCASIDFLMGYRFGRLDENLGIAQSSEWTATQGQIIPGTTLHLFDEFDTENHFHGGELGTVYRRQIGCWSLELLTKIALGNSHSVVRIKGATDVTVPDGGSASFAGGLLAQETNIGRYERNNFAVLPELGVTLGYDLTSRLRATVGYTLLYWSSVARPAEQIDLEVSQFPPETPSGAQHPQFGFVRSDFWAQGLSLGLDYRF